MVAARKRANDIANKSVIEMFESPQFEEKQPFPYLESFQIYCPVSSIPKGEGIDKEIHSSLTGLDMHIAVSPAFYTKFLEKTRTLRYFSTYRKSSFLFRDDSHFRTTIL